MYKWTSFNNHIDDSLWIHSNPSKNNSMKTNISPPGIGIYTNEGIIEWRYIFSRWGLFISGRKIWRLGATMGPCRGTPGTLPPSAPWSVRGIVCRLTPGSTPQTFNYMLVSQSTPGGLALYLYLHQYSRRYQITSRSLEVLLEVPHYMLGSISTPESTPLYAGLQ